MVGTARATLRGDDMRIGNSLGQVVDDPVHARTRAFLIRIYQFPREQRHFFGLKIQVLDQVVVDAYPCDPYLNAGSLARLWRRE